MTPDGPNWTSNPACRRRRKLLVAFTMASAKAWTKFIDFVYFSSCVKAGAVSPTPSYISSFKQGGRWWSEQKGVRESVCTRKVVRMLCVSLSKCISTAQQMVTERRRLLNRAQPHHHSHVLSSSLSLHSHSFFLSFSSHFSISTSYLSHSAILPSLSCFSPSW